MEHESWNCYPLHFSPHFPSTSTKTPASLPFHSNRALDLEIPKTELKVSFTVSNFLCKSFSLKERVFKINLSNLKSAWSSLRFSGKVIDSIDDFLLKKHKINSYVYLKTRDNFRSFLFYKINFSILAQSTWQQFLQI